MSQTIIAGGTLADMAAEVDAWCQSKGWRDEPILFDEAMELLHTEVAEISDAWRLWGLADHTDRRTEEQEQLGEWPKPEGVGSECADVLIRLLDDCVLFGCDLDAEVTAHHGRYGLHDRFLVNTNALSTMIAKASLAYGDESVAGEPAPRWTWRKQFGAIYVFLAQFCEHYGVDLQAEYRRKMQYNHTRPYRHGNKRR